MTAAIGIQALDEQYESWAKELPQAIREQFALAKVRAGLSRMPDETPVEADLASVYLCSSPGTLKRMRAEGTGPKYQQPQTNSGTTARNQKVIYLIGELKRWLDGQSTSSTMHAAELRGTMFATLQSFDNPEPFWIKTLNGVEAVLGHVLGTPLNSDLLSGSSVHIEWLDWVEALRLPWASMVLRSTFEGPYVSLLSRSLETAHRGRESTEMLEVMLKGAA